MHRISSWLIILFVLLLAAHPGSVQAETSGEYQFYGIGLTIVSVGCLAAGYSNFDLAESAPPGSELQDEYRQKCTFFTIVGLLSGWGAVHCFNKSSQLSQKHQALLNFSSNEEYAMRVPETTYSIRDNSWQIQLVSYSF